MRFAEDDAAEVMPAAPAGSLPAVRARAVLRGTVPVLLVPPRALRRSRRSGRYFEALRREIRLYHEAGFRFADVYVGGGTPTVHPEELLATLALVRSLSPVVTISIETNPNHLEPALLRRYAEAGVTRLSVGVQSFDDGLLTRMERLAKYGSGEQIRRAPRGGAGRVSDAQRGHDLQPAGPDAGNARPRPRLAARARGGPGVVLSAHDRALRAPQDGEDHGPGRSSRSASRCTRGYWAG